MKICFATRNPHKLKEIKAQLGETYTLLSLDDLGIEEELPETQATIEGNSHQKAEYVWTHYQSNCFADDSGLEVEALGGAPGVDSAFYSGSRDFQANIDLLLRNLAGKSNRRAQFKTVITLVLDGVYHSFTGVIPGEILSETRGEDGFGYDPVFLPEGYSQSFAEMSLNEKNKISHRARALKGLVDFLRT